ncbi:MAG TPA: hypothetical protein VLJ68_08320 [Chitinophagaceae bacterium]|nr:hypothetical protein [Chitinophagaceae bacterium]
MSASFEARKNSQASMITAASAGLIILLMILVKWQLPIIEKPIVDLGVEINLNIPDEVLAAGGGGGGGNPVHAAGPAGIAPTTPPQPGTKEDSKDVYDNEDKASPTILKPDKPKVTAEKINENRSVVKITPAPVIEAPAPPKPKAVVGRTLTGSGRGGGTDDFDRSGGNGNGSGVGSGNGSGGGTGGGNGGGNGTGSGPGNGPKVTRGDRKIVRYYSFQGDLEKAVIYANINVSPEGNGKFVSIARGSSTTSLSYKDAIVQYLQNIKFDRADHESMITVQFNFRVN